MNKFDVHVTQTAGRSMHALVIGVGSYPYLLGGSGDRTDSHDGMAQLTSPPVSARQMADWLISDFHHPGLTGKTVSLLLSENSPKPYRDEATGKDHEVMSATMENIRDAVKAWRIRGDQHADDMLFFYFCGHGISEGQSMVILPSDFGSDPDNAYRHALEFLNLYDGMAQYKSRCQCFVVDACRSSSDTLKNNNGENLLQVRPPAEGVRVAPAYYSSLSGEAAYGQENEASTFTRALIDSLNNFAARDDEGDDDWRVSNFDLAAALAHLMAQEQKAGAKKVQTPDSTEIHTKFYLHHLRSPPKALLRVVGNPPDKLESATLSCVNADLTKVEREPQPGDDWWITVPTGKVEVTAALPEDASLRPSRTTIARPIYKRITVDLT